MSVVCIYWMLASSLSLIAKLILPVVFRFLWGYGNLRKTQRGKLGIYQQKFSYLDVKNIIV